MHAFMNAEALKLTIETKEAHYYSRSRKCIWHKGATSGFVQKVDQILIDDDQDCVWIKVTVAGNASCHVGYFIDTMQNMGPVYVLIICYLTGVLAQFFSQNLNLNNL